MPAFEYAPGARLTYLDTHPSDQSSGPVVVLLHGLGVSGRSWRLQLPPLVQAGYRVLAVDLPGFGGSTAPAARAGRAGRLPPGSGMSPLGEPAGAQLGKASSMSPLGEPAGALLGKASSMWPLATPVAALLDHLGLPVVALGGISMGGTVALQLALDHPQQVERLLLVNTFARLMGGPPDRADGGARGGAGSALRLWPYYLYRYLLVQTVGLERQARAVAGRLFPNPAAMPLRVSFVAQVLQADPAAYRATMRRLALFDVERRLGEICMPALVVTGARDTIVAPAVQRRLAHGLPRARQVVIANAGHAVIAEQPQAFNRVMVEFLIG